MTDQIAPTVERKVLMSPPQPTSAAPVVETIAASTYTTSQNYYEVPATTVYENHSIPTGNGLPDTKVLYTRLPPDYTPYTSRAVSETRERSVVAPAPVVYTSEARQVSVSREYVEAPITKTYENYTIPSGNPALPDTKVIYTRLPPDYTPSTSRAVSVTRETRYETVPTLYEHDGATDRTIIPIETTAETVTTYEVLPASKSGYEDHTIPTGQGLPDTKVTYTVMGEQIVPSTYQSRAVSQAVSRAVSVSRESRRAASYEPTTTVYESVSRYEPTTTVYETTSTNQSLLYTTQSETLPVTCTDSKYQNHTIKNTDGLPDTRVTYSVVSENVSRAPSVARETSSYLAPAPVETTTIHYKDTYVTPDLRTYYYRRVTRLLAKYAPEKLHKSSLLLDKFKGLESELMAQLVEEYGPEPVDSERTYGWNPTHAYRRHGGDQESPIFKYYLRRLTRLFTKYSPGRVEEATELLKKHEGDEAALIFDLTKQYGPEPSENEALPSATPRTASLLEPETVVASEPVEAEDAYVCGGVLADGGVLHNGLTAFVAEDETVAVAESEREEVSEPAEAASTAVDVNEESQAAAEDAMDVVLRHVEAETKPAAETDDVDAAAATAPVLGNSSSSSQPREDEADDDANRAWPKPDRSLLRQVETKEGQAPSTNSVGGVVIEEYARVKDSIGKIETKIETDEPVVEEKKTQQQQHQDNGRSLLNKGEPASPAVINEDREKVSDLAKKFGGSGKSPAKEKETPVVKTVAEEQAPVDEDTPKEQETAAAEEEEESKPAEVEEAAKIEEEVAAVEEAVQEENDEKTPEEAAADESTANVVEEDVTKKEEDQAAAAAGEEEEQPKEEEEPKATQQQTQKPQPKAKKGGKKGGKKK